MKPHVPIWEDLINILNIKDIDQFDNLWDSVNEIFDPFIGYSPSTPIVALMIQTQSIIYSKSLTNICLPINFKHITRSPMGESDEHLILKHTAYCILTDLGTNDVLFEDNYWDVYSNKLKTRVECGHTDPGRLIDFLQTYEDNLFWVLSYPKTDNTHTTIHKFKSNEKTKPFIELYRRRQNELAFIRRKQASIKETIK